MVNLHIFKMAAIENFNVLQTSMVGFRPHKCIGNRYKHGVSESIVDFPYTLHILWIAVGIFVITRV